MVCGVLISPQICFLIKIITLAQPSEYEECFLQTLQYVSILPLCGEAKGLVVFPNHIQEVAIVPTAAA